MQTSKPAWESKVNWTQIISVLAMALALFGIEVDEDTQAQLAMMISSITGAATIIWRTWFTKTNLH